MTIQCTQKTAGVSFTAAASPTSEPRGHHTARRRARSVRHSATMTAFTWPYRMLSCIGCSCTSTAATTPWASPARRPNRASSGRKATPETYQSSTSWTPVQIQPAARNGTSSSGVPTRAANGG